MSSPVMLSHAAPLFEGAAGAIVDLWGVVHNGVAAFPAALDALDRFKRGGGRVVLLSNAPRPSDVVVAQLDRLGVDRALYDDIVTSGDSARAAIAARSGARLYHIGPPRDLPLFEGLDVERVASVAKAEAIVCSGLLDDETETAADYRAVLAEGLEAGLTLVCANPDRIVARGDRVIPCAGAVARLYAEMGGAVEWHGKPHARVYDLTLARLGTAPDRTLAVGDGIETDIPGANAQGIPALLVTGGVHADLWGDPADPIRLAERLDAHGLHVSGAIDRLRW
ncbi:TIGR01459 family HAD-type hydrolase [Zavarzinia compransoris]|uniref:TIGR01459 family HAD-type hydrolase n=1 Tax=Zavarzinia marina TaxID=2911065 RepID=UPI001F42CB01|nr:TIGR01459 family HAD-type hydrolase [Zavarzinia marina]MCF4164720.1 TIGR01459 family HAD-type hydrolase [Zavarzinia marina]